jgi:hypothetical protein
MFDEVAGAVPYLVMDYFDLENDRCFLHWTTPRLSPVVFSARPAYLRQADGSFS